MANIIINGVDTGILDTAENAAALVNAYLNSQGQSTGNNAPGNGPGATGTIWVNGQDTGIPDTAENASALAAGSSGNAQTSQLIDWSNVLGEYGLPDDVRAELDRIFASTGNNLDEAIPIAQAYVRGTQWYATNYPGIQAGINAGLFSNEAGYNAYKNQINQLYQQYYGRVATAYEVSQYAQRGQSSAQVANQFQAGATLGNLSDPLKALFTPDELQAYANETAGIDSQLGQKILAEANLATQVQSLYQDFYGRPVTRAELDQLTSQGLNAAQVSKQFATQENINAMDPAIRDLFTPDEIQQIALDQAGGITQNGAKLKKLADLALQLNPIYHQYTNAGVSRQEIEDAYNQGLSPDTVGKQFAGAAYIAANQGDIQQASGAFGDTGQFSAAQLKSLGEEQAGLDTPQGQAVAAAYQKALTRLHGVFQGVLAHPALQLANGRLSGAAAGAPPDVAA